MEEDWQKLEDDWKGHEYALVAEVDCTSDGGQPICEDFEIQVRARQGLMPFLGFPTKFGFHGVVFVFQLTRPSPWIVTSAT